MNTHVHAASKPWYREPWPWFLMSLPAAAVLAGITTVWFAVRSADGLVVGDYYKAGLAINQTLARDDTARALGLVATLTGDDHALSLTLDGHLDIYPEAIILLLAHPTRQGQDHHLELNHAGNGHYRTPLPQLAEGKWALQIADSAGTWRLAGVVHTPFSQPVRFVAAEPSVHSPGRPSWTSY